MRFIIVIFLILISNLIHSLDYKVGILRNVSIKKLPFLLINLIIL